MRRLPQRFHVQRQCQAAQRIGGGERLLCRDHDVGHVLALDSLQGRPQQPVVGRQPPQRVDDRRQGLGKVLLAQGLRAFGAAAEGFHAAMA